MRKSVHLLQICFMGVYVLSAPHGCCQKCNCDEESKNEYIYIYIYPCAPEQNFAAFCVRVQYVNTLNLVFNVRLLNKHSSSPINKAPTGYSFIHSQL